MSSPKDLRKLLSASYRLDEARGVYSRGGDQAFAYSDGAAAETYLAETMAGARDLAIGSEELAARIRDWPSRYHLSPARPNLLRPIAPAIKGLVLEVGAGCGAITRLLGESGATVLAVEGSLGRAAIAAARCRDLPNVVVVCDNFANLELPLRADLVTLIGVLEYSRMFLEGDDPVQEMLARAGRFLGEGGLLALAIENQLGVKYLAGAREDHTGLPFFGVADRYGPKTPVTFGEGELRGRLAQAGYVVAQCLYPFPDYKLPAVLVTEGGFGDPRLNVVDLIATSMRRRDPTEGTFVYSESLARNVFVRNGLGAATANSFLFLAGRDDGTRAKMPEPSVLAFSYSGDRRRGYAKETRTVATPQGLEVTRRALYKAAKPTEAPVTQRFADEEYVPGTVLFRDLERIVARPEWSVDEVAAWMRPLADYLQRQAPEGGALAANLFDCTPFNVIRRDDGALVPIDLEWELAHGEALDAVRVVFRGLWNSLARVDDVAEALAGTPTDLYALVLATMERLGLAVTDEQGLRWIKGEYAFVDAVSAKGEEVPAVVPHLRVGGEIASLPRVAGGLGGADAASGRGPRFSVQAYYRGHEEGYAEEHSVSAPGGGQGDRILAHLSLPARERGYAKIRLDPIDVPGLIRIERVALFNARSELLWETRTCRPPDFEGPHQLRDLSRITGAASGTIWFSEGLDPHFELALPAHALGELDEGGALVVEMSRLDAAELGAIVRLALLAGEPTSGTPRPA